MAVAVPACHMYLRVLFFVVFLAGHSFVLAFLPGFKPPQVIGPAVMSFNNTTTASSNLYYVPELADDRSNWITYKERIYMVLGACSLMRHLDGTARRPLPLFPGSIHLLRPLRRVPSSRAALQPQRSPRAPRKRRLPPTARGRQCMQVWRMKTTLPR